MVDASRYDLEGNIKMTKEIVEFARQFDASVEGKSDAWVVVKAAIIQTMP